MKAEYINPFIQGAQNVLVSVCNENAHLGKVYIKNKPYNESVFVAINIIGELKGKVLFSMDEKTACSIASKMMMNMPVAQLDDMSKSALCELSNMISGHVATIFSSLGKNVDIETPNFFTTSEVIDNEKLLCVPLSLSSGENFEINVWVSE